MKKRVEEELEKRRTEIEQEVSKRVDEAKAKMEQELILELEQRRDAAREEERKREVRYPPAGVCPPRAIVGVSLLVFQFSC